MAQRCPKLGYSFLRDTQARHNLTKEVETLTDRWENSATHAPDRL